MAYKIGFFINDNDLYYKELARFNTLAELDTFTMKKINESDVKIHFSDEVAEYMVGHKKILKESKGSIKVYDHDDKDNIIYYDILYKGFKMFDYEDFVQLLRIEFKKETDKLKKKGSRSTLDSEVFIKICKKYNIDFGNYQEKIKNSLREYALYLRNKDFEDFLEYIKYIYNKKNNIDKYLFLRNVSLINNREKILKEKSLLDQLKTRLGIISNIHIRNIKYSLAKKNEYNYNPEQNRSLDEENLDDMYDIPGLTL